MSVGAVTFRGIKEKVGFVFAETVPCEKFWVSPNILIASVEVEDNWFGWIKDFNEDTKLAVMGAISFLT